ncbi:MAG: hypothetical protein ACJATI_000897 [Halioglobus sp.]|jgi:hypothetical protein
MVNIIKVDNNITKGISSVKEIYIYPIKINILSEIKRCIILDVLYGNVPVIFNNETTSLEIDLSGFPDFHKTHFENYVKNKGLIILLDDGRINKYKDVVSILIDKVIPSRKNLLMMWLKKSKVLKEGEMMPVSKEEYCPIFEKMTVVEKEELAGLFLIDDKEINPIKSRSVPYTISLHSKSDMDWDDIGESDLYIKIHDESISLPLILFNNGDAGTMKETSFFYELPYPSELLFSKHGFSEEEKNKFREACEIIYEYSMQYFDVSDVERSKLGGYFEDDLKYADIGNDSFDYNKDWKQLLTLSSYSHPCDFFADIGDCHANIMVIESEKEGMVVMESRIILRYT